MPTISCYTQRAMEGIPTNLPTTATTVASPAAALLRRLCVLIVAALLGLLPLAAAAQQTRDEAASELESVRERIESLQADLQRDSGRRSKAERELRKVEEAEQQARRELKGAQRDVRAAVAQQQELAGQATAQQADLAAQRVLLAEQLRAAYISGDGERLRLLLSQEDPAELGRRMVYYEYLSRQRSADIEQVGAAVAALSATQAALAQQLRQLEKLQAVATDKVSDISATRDERAKLVARIGADISSRDAEINQLKTQAEALTTLVAALAKALPEMQYANAEPFAGQAERLDWPADGPVLKRFGQPRADGSLKWSGVLVGAAPGAEVRSVYHGRVVFADWLSGMGLLTIVEHGDGYMSLYGHNQDLLKPVGAYVVPGEAIAHVGDSGGQANAGLYFEIRKDGEPVDPQRWID